MAFRFQVDVTAATHKGTAKTPAMHRSLTPSGRALENQPTPLGVLTQGPVWGPYLCGGSLIAETWPETLPEQAQ